MSATVPAYHEMEQQSENSVLPAMSFKEFLDLRKVSYKVKKNGEPCIRSKKIKALQSEYQAIHMKKFIDAWISYSKTNDEKWLELDKKRQEASFECPICYESISNNMVLNKCGHKLCISCFSMHIRENNSCPICRDEICRKPKKVIRMPPEMRRSLIEETLNEEYDERDGLTMRTFILNQFNKAIRLITGDDPDMLPPEMVNELKLMRSKMVNEITASHNDMCLAMDKYYTSFM